MSLRLAFLISAVLHVAAVAAFSLSTKHQISALDEARPISLTLAVSRPPRPTPRVPSPVEVTPSEPMVAVSPPQPVENPPSDAIADVLMPQPVIARTVVSRPIEPAQVEAKNSRMHQPTTPDSRAVSKRVARTAAAPLKPLPAQPKPIVRQHPAVAVAAAVDKPKLVEPVTDVQATQHYLAALAAQINRSKFYPRASRRRGEEGMVVVSFVLQRDGELTELTVAESSGVRRLDEAALKTLQRVTPFKPIPDNLARERWPISVPIAFSLRG